MSMDFEQILFQLPPRVDVPARSLSGVVQTCPRGGTNWRSSSQIRQRGGGSAVSGYEVPQAQQMWIGIEHPFITGAGRPAATEQSSPSHSIPSPQPRESS